MQETQETWVRSLGWEDDMEDETATYSSILVWKTLWSESLAGCSPWVAKSPTQLSTQAHSMRLFSAALGLHCCLQALSNCISLGPMLLTQSWQVCACLHSLACLSLDKKYFPSFSAAF